MTQSEFNLNIQMGIEESVTFNHRIQFHQKYENKNLVYTTNDQNIIKSHGNLIPSAAFDSLVRDILKNTNFIIEEYQQGQLIRIGTQGNYGGFADLMIDENPSIKFGAISILPSKDVTSTKNLNILLTFYENMTNTIKQVTFTDDDILSHTFTIISRENICEVIFKDNLLFRPLTTMGVKPIKVKNTDLMTYLSLKEPNIEKYQSNMMALDNNLILQCNLMEIVDIFKFKTIQGKRLFSTMIRGPLIDKEEIRRKQEVVRFLSEHDTDRIENLLSFYPDLIKIAKRIENGRISLNDIVFVYQVLKRKDQMYSELKHLVDVMKKPEKQNLFSESAGSKKSSDLQDDEFSYETNSLDFSNDKNVTEFELPGQIFIYEEMIQPLEVLSFESLIDKIEEFIDTEESTIKSTTEAIQNIKIAKNELLEQRDIETRRIAQIFNKKFKIENFTIKISRNDYNQKFFKENFFVERSVLKAGVIFTTKILNDLEIKDQELKEIELKEERKIINHLIESLRENLNGILAFNMVISIIDCYCGMANRLIDPEWSLPIIKDRADLLTNEPLSFESKFFKETFKTESDRFIAKDAFHPLVRECIKNDIDFSFSILTGPNTAGKSTYLKTIAIIVILGQMGCAVPAEKCEFILRKGIYMRAGAHDLPGYSTFMLEMIDMARIVKNSGSDSLVLIDELGRGTSAIDGISLCIAIKEHLQKMKCSTIFATHFNDEPLFFENVKEFICAETIDGMITFKMKEGIAQSLGIEVAKKLGFPKEIIEFAENYY
ncbi:Mismatch repair ATPase MSH2 (MutS family) [Pseudoloma neurophilia]|uniref:Mismatch repair ATPase MSH2 (MutS family) n=1 Tax=Pseudoloma neurophilia TaxID=146866 RepID=A0A0R0M8I9_9MICR|nr:Mismatch repair ATPase MSH2 (MutS family) [Pseudoloma neurophilia]